MQKFPKILLTIEIYIVFVTLIRINFIGTVMIRNYYRSFFILSMYHTCQTVHIHALEAVTIKKFIHKHRLYLLMIVKYTSFS